MQIIGKDGKEYSTVEKCKEADKAFDKAQEEKRMAEEIKKAEISKERKELADKIDAAKDAYNLAVEAYNEAKAEARKIIEEANARANEILKEAGDNVDKAATDKRNAMVEYNDKFNKPYVRYITGDEAKREYDNIVDEMNSMLNDMFTFNPFKLFQ